jgi:hypothetical protein
MLGCCAVTGDVSMTNTNIAPLMIRRMSTGFVIAPA